MVRTRFAPSPTGFLHVGGVRTALFNWLFARKHGGEYILRIDDTDTERNVDAALQPILDGFRWLGLTWDEGPEIGGKHGPYYQSQRADLYKAALEKLKAVDAVYEDGGAYRLRMAGDKIVLNDLVRGTVEWDASLIKDPVIVRKDGRVLYNFATVVDDVAMEISHIFRAEEHLSNTPVQLRVYQALGVTIPAFGHLPFVCAPNAKRKLSKRDDTPVTVDHYQNAGYCPMGVINYLSLLGWSLDDHTELFTLKELIDGFDVKGIHNSPASFDPRKFLHINAEQMKRLPTDDKIGPCTGVLNNLGIFPDVDKLRKVIEACGDRLKTFNDIVEYGVYFFRDPVYDEKAFQKRLGDKNTVELLFRFMSQLTTMETFQASDLEAKLHDFCEVNGVKIGDMVHAIRVAVTGQPVGPGVFDCMALLGQQQTINRAAKAIDKARGQ
jgi:glutamyl-tRNA synthetase